MEQIPVNVNERIEIQHPSAKALRREGLIPAVVYHRGDPTVAVALAESDFFRVLHSEAGRNALVKLSIKNEKTEAARTVVVKEIQYHPLSGKALHVDFQEISLTEKIQVMLQVVERGEAIGVKTEDGILEFPLREIEVECLPTNIPEHIEVDISELHINDAIHVRDLKVDPKITILTDAERIVVHVVTPHVEKPAEEAAEVEEPEVIGEKKEEGEEGAEEQAAEKPEEGKKPEAKSEKKAEK